MTRILALAIVMLAAVSPGSRAAMTDGEALAPRAGGVSWWLRPG